MAAATAPHAAPREAVLRRLGSDARTGLTGKEAARRLAEHGPNVLADVRGPGRLALALRQLADPLVGLLAVAAAVSTLIGEGIEAAAIAVILLLNGLLGYLQEAKAERAIAALRDAFPRRAAVVRDGREQELDAAGVVPGDLLVLREGDRVPADARVVAAAGLEADESALTGESLPVAKGPARAPEEASLGDRGSMVHAGTSVSRGRGRAVVTATGRSTELGRVADLAAAASPPPTPLQARLGRLAALTAAAGVLLTVGLGGAMLAHGSTLHEAFLTGVSVAVAAVPEGLLATVTVALGLGAAAMAARGAIVRRLVAIETIGATTLACTDKTGTLTENRLRVAAVLPVGDHDRAGVLAAAALASTARLVEEEDGIRVAGDPVEGALLLAALEEGLSRGRLLARRSVLAELPFSSERRRMSVVYESPDGRHAYAKGAVEALLARAAVSGTARAELERTAHAWAGEGLRVLAVAERPLAEEDALDEATVERDVEPVGLVALHDPIRAGAAEAVAEARRAGVEVRMLTGDHPATARTVGAVLGLEPGAVHARVTPAEKLAIVEAAQRDGHVVLVTGDGVNDAPALRRADVGVAMGRAGTEPAREAADIVLVDDEFGTIVAAIREGRRIGDDIRKVVAFLLSANLGEVLLFAAAVLAGLGAPMGVVQVLVVNVLTDGLPALALARDPAAPDAMRRPPRPRDELLPRGLLVGLGVAGALVGLAGLTAFLLVRALDSGAGQTAAFVTVAVAELLFVFSCRSDRIAAWRMPRNPLLVWSVLGSGALVAAAVYAPFLRPALGTVPLGPYEAAVALGLAVVPALGAELAKAVRRHARTRTVSPREPEPRKEER